MLKFKCSNSKALFPCLTQLPSEYILLSATFYTSCKTGSWEEVQGTASLTLRDATGQAEIQGDPKRGRELDNAREPLQQTVLLTLSAAMGRGGAQRPQGHSFILLESKTLNILLSKSLLVCYP